MQRALINGVESEYLSVMDRGLHYGDGLFETIACIDRRPVFLEQHLHRMENAARRLDLPFPGRQYYRDDIDRLIRDSDGSCVIKLLLTRGPGRRGYRYDVKQSATRISMRTDWPPHIENWHRHGVRLMFCRTPASINPVLAGIKSLNRLENVLAGAELGKVYDEGLLSDSDGNVIEGTMSNVFAVLDGELLTPQLTRCGIAGIVREQVIDIARGHDIRLAVRDISRDELLQAEEIFISNSVIGVCRVRQLEQQHLDADTITTIINTNFLKRIEADAKAAA